MTTISAIVIIPLWQTGELVTATALAVTENTCSAVPDYRTSQLQRRGF